MARPRRTTSGVRPAVRSAFGIVAMVAPARRLSQRADAVRVSDCVEGFGKHVEEGNAEDDASGQRDQRRQLPPEPERDVAADERRDDRQRSERDSDPVQWQSLQVP